jgi:LPS-assembly protein
MKAAEVRSMSVTAPRRCQICIPTCVYEYVSDDSYLRDLSNNLDFLTVNYLERHLDSRYYGNGWQALARVQGYQILNPALFAVSGKPYQRLPQLLFTGAWPPVPAA